MIQLEQVSKHYGGQTVFEGLSWHIKKGRRIGLVGPNGSGKTTLLKILCGREIPDGGRIRAARHLRIGFLPQEVEAEPFMESSLLAAAMGGRTDLRALETELEQLEAEMAAAADDPPRLARASARYGEARTRFEALEGYTFEAETKSVLAGLGFSPGAFHLPVTQLSGGFRMRVALARILVGRPGLLLLDEPTNHLDLESLGWLEGWLAEYGGSAVVVSHDRYFLNRTVRRIAEMSGGRLTRYVGGYDDYLEQKEKRQEALRAARKQQDREVARLTRFVERFRYKAKKAAMVQSRVKRLAKIERIEPEGRSRAVRFRFPPPPRSGEEVVVLESLTKRFGEKVVYDGVDLRIRRGERVALMGPNGSGKTTLLRLIAGDLRHEGGTRRLGHQVTASYYAQHQLESLEATRTVLAELATAAPVESVERLRSVLGAFLFSGDDVDKRVGVLSGGEKARLALAKMLLRPVNLLLLDEPTNHLDLQAREVLEDALNEYPGTFLVISHDRYFINRVATETLEVGPRALIRYPGDYDAYRQAKELEAEAASEGKEAGEDGTQPDTGFPEGKGGDRRGRRGRKTRERRRAEAESRQRLSRRLRPLKQRLAGLEQEISRLEEHLASLDRRQADPEVYRDGEQARSLAEERREAEMRLAALYTEWAEVGESIAAVEGE